MADEKRSSSRVFLFGCAMMLIAGVSWIYAAALNLTPVFAIGGIFLGLCVAMFGLVMGVAEDIYRGKF